MLLGTKVGLGHGRIVLHGDQAPPPKRDTTPNFRPMSIVAKRSPISATAELLLIDILIGSLLDTCVGCWVKQMYVGCIVYADDVILLSPSVNCLQMMPNTCRNVSIEWR